MSSNKSRLGRGLGGLIAGAGSAVPKSEAVKTTSKKTPQSVPKKAGAKTKAHPAKGQKQKPAQAATAEGFLELELGLIETNPYQPRREISEQQVEDLAQSIRAEGLIQPIVVRQRGQ